MSGPQGASPAEDQHLNEKTDGVRPDPFTCAACRQTIAGVYYSANGRVMCEPCAQYVHEHWNAGQV